MTTLDKMLQGLANALGASLSTLTTTAKTVVGAINELKSGLTSTNTTVSGHTSKIGTGSLNTTSQTLIGAVNELKASLGLVGCTKTSKTFTSSGASSAVELRMSTFAASDKPRLCFYRFYYTQSSGFSSVSVDPYINVIGESYVTESTTDIQSGISSIYGTGVTSTNPYQRYKIGFAFIPPNKKFLVTAYASQARGYGTATFDVYLLTLNAN